MIIRIKKLRTSSLVGILPEEYITRQPLIVDIELHYNYKYDQTSSENLPELDYSHIEQFLKTCIETGHHGLLEDLAHHILSELFKLYPIIEQGRVILSKPKALKNSETVEVELTLGRF